MPDPAADLARTRTYTWQDPRHSVEAAMKMSGLEVLLAAKAGTIPRPPIFNTLDFDDNTLFEPGKAVFLLEPKEFHYNPIGSVHGGVLATLLDSAVGCAVQTMLPAGTGYTSLELKVNFTRAVRVGSGVLRCEGTVLTMGRQIATAEGRLTDPEGRLCAHCTTTCLIMTPKS